MQQLRVLRELWVRVTWANDHTQIDVYTFKPYSDPSSEKVRLVHLMPDDALELTHVEAEDTPYETIMQAHPGKFVLEAVPLDD